MTLIKKLFFPLVVLVFSASIASASSWHERFVANYAELGIDLAVQTALEEGATPHMIVKNALPIEDLEEEVLVKALFCAGAEPNEIKKAALDNNIQEDLLNEGFRLAITECRRIMEENLNFIVPGGGGGKKDDSGCTKKTKCDPLVSPSTFQNCYEVCE